MNSKELIRFIVESEKKSPVKVYLECTRELEFENCQSFGKTTKILIGDYDVIMPQLLDKKEFIKEMFVEQIARYSAVPLSDLSKFQARIEPGAVIRDHVQIGKNAVIMMGAVVNIGAEIQEKSMIDMNAVIGARALIKKNCHIGAGAVIAGVIEPPSAQRVIIEDNVLIGANAVILEGVHIGKNAVVAAGSVVLEDVKENTVVGGVPAVYIKDRDERTKDKTILIESLRNLRK